ncbi:hypothetical protein CDD83_539 [Cordyceps sp. RAO-2017]|nr:hypothetical protein CDD83_539 [Cordyceps sp. RAO-2017]
MEVRPPGISDGSGRMKDKISSLRCNNTAVAPENLVRGCRSFDRMTVSLQIGTGWSAGTWSKIAYSFRDSQTLIKAADGPGAGTCVETEIDLQKYFGSSTVPATTVDSFTVWDVLNDGVLSDPAMLGGDKWTLESLRIDAHCADAPRTLVYLKSVQAEVGHSNDIGRPTPVHSVGIKPGDWALPSQEVRPGCGVDVADSSDHPLPEDCAHIDRLKLEIELGAAVWEGTWDSLYLAFEDGERHLIASGPGRQFHGFQEIDLAHTFNQTRVAVDHLKQVQIFQHHDSIFGDDDWKLRGIKLKARCAESLTELQVDKFASVNYKVTGMRPTWHNDWRAWSEPLDPARDWHKLFECSHLDRLEANLYMGNAISGGSYDDLFLRFDGGTGREFGIAEQPARGSDYAATVNVTEAFGSPVVPVKDLRGFSIISRTHDGNSEDQWELGTLYFHGRCAGSKKKVVIDKFDNVYEWHDRGHVFQRRINPADWHLVDAATGKPTTSPGDF